MLKKFMKENPGVTPQSKNFGDAFSDLMDKNKSFRSFILKGAHADNLAKSEEEYQK